MIRCVVLSIGLLAAVPALAIEARRLDFRYEVSLGPIQEGVGPIHLFVPLAREGEVQHVVAETIEASIPGRVETEDVYGNRFWHGSLERSDGRPLSVVVETRVERRVRRVGAQRSAATSVDGDALQRFLAPNERVPVGHPVLQPILAEVRAQAGGGDKAALARAIYDWVIDNLEYKKEGTGWGNGDTFWACSQRYGNCTDFHSLFISLARSEGIPARFEIGFPVPEDRKAGEIGGYHCWVQFHLPETGWFPIDASEAFKQPEKRELFYGTQPTDRIHFTTGRDLRLGVDHRDRPLNYFIYPYVEVAGRAWQGHQERRFSFREEE